MYIFRSKLCVLLLLLFFASITCAGELVPGDVLVVFKAQPGTEVTLESLAESGSDYERVKTIAEELDAEVVEIYSAISQKKNMIFVLLHSDSKSEDVLIQELLINSDVLTASPNTINSANSSSLESVSTNDIMLEEQWGLKAIHASQAWKTTLGERYLVSVAVIDSGIDYNHPDLKDNFDKSHSKNFIGGLFVNPSSYHDENGHGTHVAGIAGAVGNNGIGVTGVNWRTNIISLRAGDRNGHFSTADVVHALEEALKIIEDRDNPSQLVAINMSLGGFSSATPESLTGNLPPLIGNDMWFEYEAMSAVDETNCAVICVSAGNYNTEVGIPTSQDDPEVGDNGEKLNRYKKGQYNYPASFIGLRNMIVVANSTNSEKFARNSNSGYSTTYVDIAAPGTDIWSTFSSQYADSYKKHPKLLRNDNGVLYYCMSGTSMATPFVSGAAALLKSAYPNATAEQIKAAILNGANSYYAKDYTKYGFLNLDGAFRYMALQPVPVGVPIDDFYFPDKNFRAYISEKIDEDSNGYLSEVEISKVDFIDVSGRHIVSLEGIEVFTNLLALDCSNNDFDHFALSKYVRNQKLGVDCSHKKLEMLNINNCKKLKSLDVTGNENLITINASNCAVLAHLDCSENKISLLDISGCVSLNDLYCSDNKLAELNLTDCISLKELICRNNNLSALNLYNNSKLILLACEDNNLKKLDLRPVHDLQQLYCGNNNIAMLDLTGCGSLDVLYTELGEQKIYGLKSKKVQNNNGYPYEVDLFEYIDNSVGGYIITSSVKGYNQNGNVLPEIVVAVIDDDNYASRFDFPEEPAKVSYEYRTNPSRLDKQFVMKVTVEASPEPVIMPPACPVLLNKAYFPDSTFLNYCSDHIDTDHNGMLSVAEISKVTSLSLNDRRISSLKGIEYFTNLETLACNYNRLIALDLSNNAALTQLWCHHNQLTELNLSNNTALTSLSCGSNQLTELNLSGCSALTWLNCFYNPLTALNVSGCTALDYLGCGSKLIALDVSNNTALTRLDCSGNQLTALDVSNNTALIQLRCSSNQLTTLNVSGCTALTELNCRNNQLTTLDVRSCPDVNIAYDEGVTIIRSDNAKPEILTDTLPGGITGTAYSVQLQYSGTTPITWTHKGSFPTGLTLSTSGLISGTPKKAGNFTFTVTAKNKYGTYSKKYTVKVIDPVSITTASLKAGTHEKSYTVTMKAKGPKPITWSATGLPDGLTINASTGKISGKPTAYGNFSVKITAENEAGSVTRTLALTVKAVAPTLSGSLKQSTFNVPYSSGLNVKGSDPITWSISGELPEGLTFDTSTGIISGTPKSYGKNGNFKITITASNPGGSKSKSITFKVKATAPKLSGSLKQSTLNVAYSSGLKVKGTEPIEWSISGALPDGLTFDTSTGIISGTPKEYGKNGSFKIKITSSNPVGSRSKSITFRVKGTKPTIKAKFPNATAGEYYSVNLTATGSDPITWTADLPEYLTLNGNTIAGNIPDTVPGNRIKIKVYASNPVKTVNKTYTIKVITNKKGLPENLNADNDTDSTENETGNKSDNGTPTDNNTGEVQGVTGVTGDTPQENQKSGIPESYIVVAELGEISRDVAGMYDFEVELPDSVSIGSELIYIANSETPSDDDEIAEFFDDTGKEITAVPESRKISVSVWLNAETIYKPVIAVKK